MHMLLSHKLFWQSTIFNSVNAVSSNDFTLVLYIPIVFTYNNYSIDYITLIRTAATDVHYWFVVILFTAVLLTAHMIDCPTPFPHLETGLGTFLCGAYLV